MGVKMSLMERLSCANHAWPVCFLYFRLNKVENIPWWLRVQFMILAATSDGVPGTAFSTVVLSSN